GCATAGGGWWSGAGAGNVVVTGAGRDGGTGLGLDSTRGCWARRWLGGGGRSELRGAWSLPVAGRGGESFPSVERSDATSLLGSTVTPLGTSSAEAPSALGPGAETGPESLTSRSGVGNSMSSDCGPSTASTGEPPACGGAGLE